MNKLLDSTTGYVMTSAGLKPMKLEDEKKVQAALAAAGDKKGIDISSLDH